MKTVDVTVRDVTAEGAFHLSVLADVLCPFDPAAAELLGDEALDDMDYWSALAHVLERVARRQSELLEIWNSVDPVFTAERRRACEAVINEVYEIEEVLRLYLRSDFATINAAMTSPTEIEED